MTKPDRKVIGIKCIRIHKSLRGRITAFLIGSDIPGENVALLVTYHLRSFPTDNPHQVIFLNDKFWYVQSTTTDFWETKIVFKCIPYSMKYDDLFEQIKCRLN